jgi:CRP-like cAMP-binding protein
MAMTSNKPRNATAKAVNSVKTLTIARGDFINLHDYLPALKENIDKVIQSRTAELETKDT